MARKHPPTRRHAAPTAAGSLRPGCVHSMTGRSDLRFSTNLPSITSMNNSRWPVAAQTIMYSSSPAFRSSRPQRPHSEVRLPPLRQPEGVATIDRCVRNVRGYSVSTVRLAGDRERERFMNSHRVSSCAWSVDTQLQLSTGSRRCRTTVQSRTLSTGASTTTPKWVHS